MISTWVYALISVTVVSLVALIGIVFIHFKVKKLQRIVSVLVSFAVGALLGNAIFHLLPEAFEMVGNSAHVAILFLAGVLVLFLLEKFLHWQHDHSLEAKPPQIRTFGYISLIADGFHNFTDGILIGAAWLVSPEIGVATTLAILLHEVPQEISDYAILIHAGFSKKKALLVNFMAALSAILGTILALLIGGRIEGFSFYILAFAAGGFVYLACSDLIPELHKKNTTKSSIAQLGGITAGIVLMYLISVAGHHHHGHDHHGHDHHDHVHETHVHTEDCEH
jgi:zinc and cadmium transporter